MVLALVKFKNGKQLVWQDVYKRQGRHRVAGIGVGCHRVRRNVFIQVHDLCDKGILGGIGAADRYCNGYGLGLSLIHI